MTADPWGFDGMNRHSAGDMTFWGDSLMAGTGAGSVATAVPGAVAGTRVYYNQGVGADSSTGCKARVLAGTPILLSGTTVIWIGINNSFQRQVVLDDIAAMVAFLGHTRYLVVGLCNGNNAPEYTGGDAWNDITWVNSGLSPVYGSRFVDIMTPLVAAGGPSGSNPDPTSFANGVPPSGLRFDNRHFNDAGYAIIANLIKTKITANGW
jgi:lysophospholipase L1-like esterase